MVNAKMKGKHAEYEVRDMLQLEINQIYEDWNNALVPGMSIIKPPTLSRNLEQWRSGGCDITGVEWIALEIKRQENEQMMTTWWEQTKEQALGENGEYVKEPVLIWRKSHSPWRVRMFGYLIASDKPGGMRIKCPVDINLSGFLAYFKARVLAELGAKITL